MSGRLASILHRAIAVAVSLLPWIAAMYFFYWLDSSGTWTRDTPHRGKLSVAILATGMGLSLVAWSALTRRKQK